jgi:hypothetical protein
MKKVLFFLLLLVPFCLAEQQQILFTQITFFNSSQAPELDSVTLLKGYPTPSGTGPYTLTLFDKTGNQLYSNSFSISFDISIIRVENEFKSVNEKFSIPYFKNSRLVLTKNGEVIFDKEVDLIICNNNLKCEPNENFASCPNDCAKDSKDNYCDSATDSICDPDCYEGVDYDCYLLKVQENESDKNKSGDKNQIISQPQNPVFDKNGKVVPSGENNQNQVLENTSGGLGNFLFLGLIVVVVLVVIILFFLMMNKYK